MSRKRVLKKTWKHSCAIQNVLEGVTIKSMKSALHWTKKDIDKREKQRKT